MEKGNKKTKTLKKLRIFHNNKINSQINSIKSCKNFKQNEKSNLIIN